MVENRVNSAEQEASKFWEKLLTTDMQKANTQIVANALKGTGRIGQVLSGGQADWATQLAGLDTPAAADIAEKSNVGFLGALGEIGRGLSGKYPSWSPQNRAMTNVPVLAAATSPESNSYVKALQGFASGVKRPNIGGGVPSDLYSSAGVEKMTIPQSENPIAEAVMEALGNAKWEDTAATGTNLFNVGMSALGGVAKGKSAEKERVMQQAMLNNQIAQQNFQNKLAASDLMQKANASALGAQMQMYGMDRDTIMRAAQADLRPSLTGAVADYGGVPATAAIKRAQAAQINDADFQEKLNALPAELRPAIERQDLENRIGYSVKSPEELKSLVNSLGLSNQMQQYRAGLF